MQKREVWLGDNVMDLSRRTLITTSLAGAALLTVGGVGLAFQPGLTRTPRAALKALGAREYSVLACVADQMCPGGGAFPTAAAIDVAGRVDALLAQCAPLMVKQVGQALLLLENALTGLLLDANPRPFTRSSAAVQAEILESWRLSRSKTLRGAHKALRGLVMASYYSAPETYAAVGYPGPPDYRSRFLQEASP